MNKLAAAQAALAAFSVLATACSASEPAGTKSERTRAAATIVQAALQQEGAGSLVDRRELLKPALEQMPNYEPALWHSGFVFDARRKEWLPMEDASEASAQDKRLALYRYRRSKHPDTVAGQLELARWCLQEKFTDQARAHLTRVLELNPDHQEARLLLGFRLVNGQWVEQRELAEALNRRQEDLASLKKWRPKLVDICKGLQSRRPAVREAAHNNLMAIDDPGVVAAVEVVMCNQGRSLALLGVEKLKQMKAFQAAETLTWQAVFSPWSPIREAAAIALRSHRKHDYVPLLLSALDTPVKSQVQIYESLDGRLLYRHVFHREEIDRRQVAVVDTPYAYSPLTNYTNTGQWRFGAPLDATFEERMKILVDGVNSMKLFRRDTIRKARAQEIAVAEQNVLTERFNASLCSVLSQTTKDYSPRTPSEWWDWWNDYNEYSPPKKKPVQTYYRQNGTELIATPFYRTLGRLAGDTRVWTESGPTPIAQVKVGDRVFACDVNTGRLALKPVIGKTIRPEKVKLLALQSDAETIEATAEHAFWVVGQGWERARKLQPGMILHTVVGTVALESVTDANERLPHNLVVADYHNYFVGEGKILTHDITTRRPTNSIVPGLATTRR